MLAIEHLRSDNATHKYETFTLENEKGSNRKLILECQS